MPILVKIVDSRLEYSNETFSFRKQYNYTNLYVHTYERCLNKGWVLQRFWSLKEIIFIFLREFNKMWREAKAFSAFLGNDKERETVEFLADTV